MPIPILVWAAGAGGVALAGVIGKIIYDKKKQKQKQKQKQEKSNPPSPKPAKIIFLMGETSVGKDTIRGILESGQFIEPHTATAKPHLGEAINRCGYENVQIYNTGGAEGQVAPNNNARRKLSELKKSGAKVYYVYVFDANQYFGKSKTKETIRTRLKTANDFADSQGFEFKIIGTHRDMAKKYESKINDLSNELRGQYGECEIYDLTQAKMQGEQMQQKLFDFILGVTNDNNNRAGH